jgi:CubicO group peptidase (beta-lactamase class C family)
MNTFRRVLLLIIAGITSHAYGQSIDDLVRERVEAGETPAMVVAVYQDGKTKYYIHGFADVASKRPVDSKTLFEIGSITKTFTTTAIAQQAQEGNIKLTDPIQGSLPAEVKVPVRGERSITFEDLASARSGLPRLPSNLAPADETNPYLSYTEDKLYAFLNGYTLTRDIGSQYEYSNLGMGLLGVLVGRLDKRTYRESIEQRILRPLGMKSTFLNTPGRTDKNSAVGYSNDKAVPAWTWSDASCMQGAGGLLSNAEDMITYLLANKNPPDNTLGSAMTDTHQPRLDIGRNNMKIGLGWHIRNKIIWHNGGTGGFRTFAGFEPEKKMAVVVLTNSETGADDLGFHLMDESIPLKVIPKSIPLTPDQLAAFTGDYEISPTMKVKIIQENDRLWYQGNRSTGCLLKRRLSSF